MWYVLSYRDMRWYFVGNSLSNVGTWVQNTAQILLAYQLTHSTSTVGLVVGAQFISPLFLGPVAGTVADRFDRRKVLLSTQIGSALVCSGMAFLQARGALTISALVIGALLVGVGCTFSLPALTTFVPTLVPGDDRRAALAMNGVSSNVGRALAPLLGVGVVVSLGFSWAFALNAASFLTLAVILARLRPRRHTPPRRAPLLEGLRVVARTRRLQVILLMVAAATIATDPPLVLGPSLASELGIGQASAAYFLAAFGVGTFVGSFLPSPGGGLRGAGWYFTILGAAIGFYSLATSVWWAVLFVAVAGVASLLAGAATQALILEITGAATAGRVMAVWAIAYAGSRPVATAVDSWLAGEVGPRWSGVALAMPSFVIGSLILGLRASKRGQIWGKARLEGSLPVSAAAH
jgi:MFS family permease